MKNRTLIVLFAYIFCNTIIAQTSEKSVLFTVDDAPVYTNEFIRVYNKNLDLVKDESQKDVDAYLELFVNYKLKLKEAKALGLDEKPKYKRELASYRKQLANNYLKDSEVTDALVAEAYDRVLNEVKASHILIRVDENAKPEDTLFAYNKINEARDKVISGEDFSSIAKQYSEDPSAKENGGDLGYFGGFRMVYNFENAAFSTKIGEISLPFRTRFGYHIVKTFDKRKSQGERTVAHIMISNKKKDSLQEEPETRINDIYKKLQQGEKFESLAKQFSEDKASAKNGGILNRFGKGQLSSSQFEEAAFGLKEKGAITKPIKTDYGWHIIKLIENHPVGSFEDIKRELEVKIKRDSRSKLITSAFAEKLKKRYNIKSNQSDQDYFTGILNKDYYARTWKLPGTLDKDKKLFQVGNKIFTYGDFANFLLTTQRKKNAANKPLATIVKESYSDFLNTSVLHYYEDNLEDENQDFAIVVDEYRDGLLLFDLMESEVWNAAKKDSLGLQNYFNEHKDQYQWNERIDATVASSSSESIIKKVSKYLKKGWDTEKIKETLNKSGKLNVIFTKDTMDINHQALPKDVEFKKGISKVYMHNDAFVVLKIDGIISSSPKSFDDAKGKVISDYQAYIEKNWLAELNAKYEVIINSDVLDTIKKEINK